MDQAFAIEVLLQSHLNNFYHSVDGVQGNNNVFVTAQKSIHTTSTENKTNAQ